MIVLFYLHITDLISYSCDIGFNFPDNDSLSRQFLAVNHVGVLPFFADVVHVHMVAQEDVLSFPTPVCDLDLNTVKAEDLRNISHSFNLASIGSGRLNSMVMWFDVWFPGGMKLSTSPDNEDTHWQNTVLPLATVPLEQDNQVKGELHITQDLTNHRFLNVDLKYSVNSGEEITRCFKMDDNCNDNDF